MEFIQHTLNWTKGEILEASIMTAVGLIILTGGILFWMYGNTPNAKAMAWPLIVIALLPLAAGPWGIYTNRQRAVEYQAQWEVNPTEFVQSEKARVEGFEAIFKITFPSALILVIAGAVMYYLVGGPNLQAIALGMVLLGLMTYFIDHFAQERGLMYLEHIDAELARI